MPHLVASKPKRGFFLYEDLNLDRIEPQQKLTSYAMLGPYAALQAKLATDAEFLAQIPHHLATTDAGAPHAWIADRIFGVFVACL